jgi:M6 family metalloprotease-like protein
MTEEECLDFDRRSIEAARRLAVIYRTTGYLRVPVVLMRFTDHVWREQPTPENYDFIFNSWEPDEFWTPAGSVKRFLKLNAQEHMEIDFDIMPWKTTNGTELYYSFNRSGITTALGAALNPVLDQLEDDKVDWTLYDQNGDGKIDAMLVLHSGYQAEVGNFDCYSGANFTYRIWSHAITSAPNPWVSPSTGIKVDNYAICGGHRGVCQNKHPYLGVITHEFLHLFGLPDLNDNSGEWIGKGLGSWSIMSNRKCECTTEYFACHVTLRFSLLLDSFRC